jgi:RNA polymerase sigma-70 factor (sigma-E family)
MRAEAEESFREYVRGRSAALSRVAYLLTGDRHLAEDLVQQALVNVASRWERISADDPDPYVRRTIYNQYVSWWRRRRREPVTVATAWLPDRAAPSTDATVALTVRQALGRLAPRQRAVLILRYFEDLSEAQAAAVLGVSVGTVKSQARDGLARLRLLAPELGDLVEVPR